MSFETVEFTNMCMICDGRRVVVIDRKSRTGPVLRSPAVMWSRKNLSRML